MSHTIEFIRKRSRRYASEWLGSRSSLKMHIKWQKEHLEDFNPPHSYPVKVPLLKELGTMSEGVRLSHGLAMVRDEEEGRGPRT